MKSSSYRAALRAEKYIYTNSKGEMRIYYAFLVAGTAVFALPSPQPDSSLLSPTTPVNSLTLTQPLNATVGILPDWPTICYFDVNYPPVTVHSCTPLINYLTSRRYSDVPKLWLPGATELEWVVQGCRARIVSGKWEAWFSLRDAVVEMVRVLAVCQPPGYVLGVGGSGPVGGKEGFMYGAFHMQVTGVRG